MMVYDITLDILFVGYGIGASANTKWYAMNPWKTEHRTGNNADTAHMTAMTATGVKHGNVGIGVSVPTKKLDVGGWVKSTGFIGHGTTPLGGIIMWSGSTAPTGWALCDGRTVNGYKTPNLKGRFVVGYDNGVADYNNPGNLSTKGTGSSNLGGSEDVTLTNNQMPRHNHGGSTVSAGVHSHFTMLGVEGDDSGHGSSSSEYTLGPFKLFVSALPAGAHAHTINPDGGTSAHENRPPYYTLAYIMRVY
jgi:microcystin-dependent protein